MSNGRPWTCLRMATKGDALPEEPLDVLPEPIALLKLSLGLHRVHQLRKVGITVPSPDWRVAAEPGMEYGVDAKGEDGAVGIPQVRVRYALAHGSPLHDLEIDGEPCVLQLLLHYRKEPDVPSRHIAHGLTLVARLL